MALSDTNIKMQEVDKLVNNKSTSTNVKLRELCSSSNINPWSKMKPMSVKVDESGLTSDIAKNNGYGIRLLSSNTLLDLWNKVKDNGFKGYELTNRVTGTSTNVRLGDFRNYDNDDKTPPIANLYNSDDPINLAGLPNIANKQYEKDVEGKDMVSSPTLICRDELIKNYSELNRGVLFVKCNSDGTYTPDRWCVSSIPNMYYLGYYDENGDKITKLDLTWRLVENNTMVTSANYHVMEFMTNAPENYFSTNPSESGPSDDPYTFIAIPYASHAVLVEARMLAIPFEVKSENYDIYAGESLLNYKFTFDRLNHPNINSSVSLINIKLYESGVGDPIWIGVAEDIEFTGDIASVIRGGTATLLNGKTFEVGKSYYFTISYMVDNAIYNVEQFDSVVAITRPSDIIEIVNTGSTYVDNGLRGFTVNYKFEIRVKESYVYSPQETISVSGVTIRTDTNPSTEAHLSSCSFTNNSIQACSYSGKITADSSVVFEDPLILVVSYVVNSDGFIHESEIIATPQHVEINPQS